MTKRIFSVLLLFFSVLPIASADELEGDYLYKVTTIRAATGALAGLLDWEAQLKDSEYFDDAGQERPLLMRHSQGDQWDLLVIVPMQSWTDYHSHEATQKRKNASAQHADLIATGQDFFAFYEDHFAYGPPWSAVASAYAANGFFHIEMFEAAPGKAGQLLEQRRMENTYLASTGQTPNMIFRRAAGSDVDVFTIGFHRSFEAFAAPAAATVEEKDVAAKAAGFKGLAHISFYLRSLISGHHDTLATRVSEEKRVVRLSEPVEQTASYESFGAGLDESVPAVTLSQLVSDGAAYAGQSVRVVARVAEVCQKKGCFFIAQDGSSIMRVSFKDYGFFVPTDIGGKRVTLVGEVVARDVSADEAAHYAEDLGSATTAVKPGKVYEIVATSVRVPRS